MTSRALVKLLLIASLVITIVPLAWMIVISIQTPRQIISPDWGFEPSLHSFQSLFGPDAVYGQQVINSVLIVVGATLLCLVIGGFAAYSLSHLGWSKRVTLGVLAGAAVLQLIPPMTLVPGLYVVMSEYGLLGNLQGLILANTVFNLPFATIMMKFYFDTVPGELRESAAMDGASEMKTFARVMAPLAAPGIAAVGIFTAIQVWNEFLMGLVFTTGGDEAPITVGIATLIQPQEIKFGPMAAVGAITAVPIILLVIVANRQIVAGLTRGAVKG
ncbi:carbohydrate ABC transporter permease [Phytoactinopolyspora endophytica]|uniref:carbohydrate ABC transporter permease n=1 Tax=Phytoactinopolyspora endophytica TaxID=1642495 RepID=UPI00101DB355|nr:carbohydrate ABC transporter permease [Phytoactinopolyspora endophytica]